jgi:hypothetical protein
MTVYPDHRSSGFATRAVHSGSPHDKTTGAVIPAVSSEIAMLRSFISFQYG